MATIATLDTVLRAQTSKFDRSIQRSQGVVGMFAKSLRTLSIVGAGVSAFALKAAFDFAKTGDAVGKMAKRTGLAVDELQALSFAAEQSGTDANAIELAIRGLNRNLLDAERGLSTATDNFAELGISAQQLQALSMEDRFRLIADSINAVEDESRKSALAMKVFGKSGTSILPMLGDIEELTQQFKDLGLAMSAEEIQQAEKLTDDLNIMRHEWKRLSATIGTTVIPILNKVLDLLTQIGQAGSSSLEAIGRSLGLIRGTIPKVQKALITPDTIRREELAARMNPPEMDNSAALSKLDILIDKQSALVAGFERSQIADFPQALQRNTAETLSFINRLNRQDEAQAANAIRRKQLQAEEKQLEELKKLREEVAAGNKDSITKVEIL